MAKGAEKMNPRAIIQEPVITEKASLLREGNKYAFRVHPKANNSRSARP